MSASLREIAAAAKAAHPAPRGFFLDFGDCVIELRTNSEELVRELLVYFGCFLTPRPDAALSVTAIEGPIPPLPFAFRENPPEPGKARIKEEWADIPGGRVVRKRLTGMVFLFGGGENLALGPCLANPNQVVNFVNNRYIEHKLAQGCLLGHAAGVALDGRGLALAGFSGMGKSTLALHATSLGATFVSNDRIMLAEGEHGPRMHGVAKHPRINPGTALNNPDLTGVLDEPERARYQGLPADDLWRLERKYDALVEKCFGPGRFTLAAPLSGLVLLNWQRDGGPLAVRAVDPGRRLDLLAALIKAPGLFCPAAEGGRPAEEYARLLHGCAVMEFSGGVDFAAGAAACLEFLRTGGIPA